MIPHAKDLSQEPARSPRIRIGGYPILARMADKGRADLNGTAGEYMFACPVDQILFDFKGVQAEEVRPLLETGKTDEEIAAWFDTLGTAKTPDEVKAWADRLEATRPYDNPEQREFIQQAAPKLGLDPQTVTLFDYLEADDRDSFASK